MYIKNLRLRNFRNHFDLNLFFEKGVNAVVGKNGSGKSSIIEAIQFLLFGEGYGTRDEMLNLDSLDGEVSGVLVLDDGEEVTIHRSVSDSKVRMEYAGVKYVKATDVKKLWQQLFQLDSHIFKNVNTAKQGEIPLLFDGDRVTRQAAFQKVFAVPNTTPLRNSIWNDYLKKAPPQFAVLSALEKERLANDLVLLQKEYAALSSKIDNLDMFVILSSDDYADIATKLTSCRDAIAARERYAVVQEEAIKSEARCLELRAVITELEKEIAASPPVAVLYQALSKQEIALGSQETLQCNLRKLEDWKSKAMSDEALTLQIDNLGRLTKERDELNQKLATAIAMRDHTKEHIRKMTVLNGKAVCPTCSAPLTNVAELLAESQSSLAVLEDGISNVRIAERENRTSVAKTEQCISSEKTIRAEIDKLVAICESNETVPYDAEEHGLLKAAITNIATKEAQKDKAQKELLTVEVLLHARAEELLSLSRILEAVENPEETAKGLKARISESDEGTKEKSGLLVRRAEVKMSIAAYEEKLAVSAANEDKNAKRDRYVDVLQKIYDVLHPSEFAAALIRSYSSVLENRIRSFTGRFNFPYAVEVDSEFNIITKADNGKLMPAVSGGQKMIVGLAIRLALHTLFSQSFGVMLIDEASQNLDVENQELLFDLVKSLKESDIEQIVIIDHNEGLANVVNNTIRLT